MKKKGKKLDLILSIDTVAYCSWVLQEYKFNFFHNIQIETQKNIEDTLNGIIGLDNNLISEFEIAKNQTAIPIDKFIDYMRNQYGSKFKYLEFFIEGNMPIWLDDNLLLNAFVSDLQLIQFFQHLDKLENNLPIQQPIERKSGSLYNDIFANNGFQLFEYILENHVKNKGQRGRYNDLSFYYWKMYNNIPKYIHQRPESFREWFNTINKEELSKIRTLTEVSNVNREKHYSSSLDWFKIQS